MKYLILTTLLFISLISTTRAQDKPAYQLFKNNGKTANYNKMIKDHYNPISHWMQLEVSKSLFEIKGDSLFFGAEMLESGNQLVLNEYLSGLYPESKMIPEMTQMWNNYDTDYRPLVEFAKENKLRFIATNIPRRYASLISKKGISALKELSPEALALIGPDLETYFDPTVKAYAEMADNMGGHVPPNMLNIQTAQAAKDATMAHFSLKNFNLKKEIYYFI